MTSAPSTAKAPSVPPDAMGRFVVCLLTVGRIGEASAHLRQRTSTPRSAAEEFEPRHLPASPTSPAKHPWSPSLLSETAAVRLGSHDDQTRSSAFTAEAELARFEKGRAALACPFRVGAVLVAAPGADHARRADRATNW
jgi:hypothetical protein